MRRWTARAIALCAAGASLVFAAQAAHAMPTGLIHRWSGEGDAADSVGGAHGTLGGTTAFAPGLNGQAFDFDAAQSSVVSLPVNINPSVLPQMTMGMWIKIRSVPNARGWVMGHDNGSFDRSIAVQDDRYGYGVAGGTGLNPHGSTLIKPADNLDTWICVAAAYDATTATATFYANGLSQTVVAAPAGGHNFTTLGGLATFANHTVDGLVDEVFLFDRALTEQEIGEACAAVVPPPDADGDGIPDTDDDCPDDAANDADGDGLCADVDPCTATSAPACVTIVRGGLGGCDDTFLSGDYPTWAPGPDVNLWSGKSGGGNHNKPMFQFDLSPIPPGSEVQSATFQVRVSWNEFNNAVGVHQVLAPWSSATVTAASFANPAFVNATPEGSFLAGSVGFRSVDVTDLAAGWVDGSIDNHGVILIEPAVATHHYLSSEASMTLRPRLEICYVTCAP